MKFINKNKNTHGRDIISNLINRLLHEFLGLVPAIIPTILFCKANAILLLDELPPKMITCFIME
jgi:hypothetical protein